MSSSPELANPQVIQAIVNEAVVIEAIVPTVVFPFVLVGAILSSLVTAIAGFFGVKWESETPRRLLRWILQPKVLLSAVALNLVVLGGYQLYKNFGYRSRPLWWIHYQNQPSTPSDRTYVDTWNINQRQANDFAWTGNRLVTGWKTQLPGSSFRGVAISGESLFTGSDDGYVYELDRHDGRVLRKFYVGRAVTPLPLIWNNTLFVGEGVHATTYARVYAFDLVTGKLRGAIQTRGHTEGDLVIGSHNGRTLLFIAAGADGLYAADPLSLQVAWHSPITHFDSGVLVHEGRVYASTGVEKGEAKAMSSLYALDFATGEILWQTDTAASGWGRPIVSGDSVCIGVGEIYQVKNYGQLACYRASDGANTRALNFRGPVFNTPLTITTSTGARVLVTDFRRSACLTDLAQNAILWCHDLELKKPPLYASPAIAGSNILLPTDVALKVLDLNTGRALLEWTPEDGSKWGPTYAGLTLSGQEAYLVDRKGLIRQLVSK
ncbi:MAG: PQQ-binding-like beta-propeller repeat protein [Bdellovibrionaceae bacterium]|nr:PQQ-binding-like beta-propeller repeat protein [Pseudobdellovibrionaceae bacterium]